MKVTIKDYSSLEEFCERQIRTKSCNVLMLQQVLNELVVVVETYAKSEDKVVEVYI